MEIRKPGKRKRIKEKVFSSVFVTPEDETKPLSEDTGRFHHMLTRRDAAKGQINDERVKVLDTLAASQKKRKKVARYRPK